MTRTALILAALAATPAMAEAPMTDADSAFVESNILAIFYHEMGHALIDIEDVPIFGQEEDAADVFSIFLIDAVFDEESAQAIAYDTAFGFAGEAAARDAAGDDVAWWDVHGPDEQRYFNTICLFYGANPDSRADLAQELGLPDDRAEYCPDEYDQANHSWGSLLDELVERGPGDSFRFTGDTDSLTGALLAQEIRDLNAEMTLSAPLGVTIESCGEANAYYDPEQRQIVFCSELEDHLLGMRDNL